MAHGLTFTLVTVFRTIIVGGLLQHDEADGESKPHAVPHCTVLLGAHFSPNGGTAETI